MAKDDRQKVFDTSMDKVKQSENEYNALNAKISGRGDTTWDRATENYNPAFAGYKSYAEGGGLTPADIERMNKAYGSGGGGGGSVSNPLAGKTSHYGGLTSAFNNAYRPDYTESDTGFRKLASASGGFDQAKLDQIYGNVDTLTGIGQTGGITQEDKDNILRAQMLDQEKTGGYSEQDKALVRAKSAASSPAYFSALKDNLERQRSQTGNLANAGAVDYKLNRQSAQQQHQDRLAQEMALQESVRGGKERAGQFLSQKGLDLAGLRTANQLSGARSAGDLGLNTQMGITANQAEGLRGLAGSQTNLGQWGLGQAGGLDQFGLTQAGGLDQFDISNASLEQQAQASNAARSAAGAAENARYQQWLTEYGNEQKQYGITGLNDLYKTNLGASEDFTQMGLQGLNSKFGTQGSLLGLASQNRGKTLGENVGDYAKIAAAGAATYFTGGAAAPLLYQATQGLGSSPGAGTGWVNPYGATTSPADYGGRQPYISGATTSQADY